MRDETRTGTRLSCRKHLVTGQHGAASQQDSSSMTLEAVIKDVTAGRSPKKLLVFAIIILTIHEHFCTIYSGLLSHGSCVSVIPADVLELEFFCDKRLPLLEIQTRIRGLLVSPGTRFIYCFLIIH